MGRFEGTDWNGAAPIAEAIELPTEGILAGTSVATAEGWRAVETIRPGERVLTFDAGPQRVMAVEQSSRVVPDLTGLPHLWPLAVPPQALGNGTPLLLLPEQPVLIEADEAELRWGDPFVLVPALALDGWNGIARAMPGRRRHVVQLHFAEEQMVYCNGGALLACPPEGSALDRMLAAAEAAPRLSWDEAAELLRSGRAA